MILKITKRLNIQTSKFYGKPIWNRSVGFAAERLVLAKILIISFTDLLFGFNNNHIWPYTNLISTIEILFSSIVKYTCFAIAC